jgi:hypothetical protein
MVTLDLTYLKKWPVFGSVLMPNCSLMAVSVSSKKFRRIVVVQLLVSLNCHNELPQNIPPFSLSYNKQIEGQTDRETDRCRKN